MALTFDDAAKVTKLCFLRQKVAGGKTKLVRLNFNIVYYDGSPDGYIEPVSDMVPHVSLIPSDQIQREWVDIEIFDEVIPGAGVMEFASRQV